MKNLIILFLVLAAGNTFCQGFEGTIQWKIKAEITDPQRKAQLEEAQKKMNDPATQAQMKQMQEKMNDPQFKTMLENNPQLKAQLEKAVTAMQSGNVNSLFPTSMVIKVKNENTLNKMEGGVMGFEILYIKDKNQAYTLDRENKTYSPMKNAESAGTTPGDGEVKVTKTAETAKILGYTCTKYIVEITSNGQTVTQNIWATTEIKDLDLKSMSKQQASKEYKLYFDKIDGVPLKVELGTKDAKMTMEVTSLKKETLPASTFAIPADYKEVASMFR